MNQVTLDGYFSWQSADAPPGVVNFADNLDYTVVESFEITPDSAATSIPFTQALQSSSSALFIVTAVYMEVYSGFVYIGNTGGGGLMIAGQPAHSFGGGGEDAGPSRALVGRFFYTFPTDDGAYPSAGTPSLIATPGTGASAKIWVFVR